MLSPARGGYLGARHDLGAIDWFTCMYKNHL